MTAFCRDCFARPPDSGADRCPSCHSPRLLRHPELDRLSIAHVDCDAFYANVEKRDRPELADKPVIVGGRTRGVVLACCYVARIYGVRSAMPMFKALRLCPDAHVIKPDMVKYREVGHRIRAMMLDLTPLVEPISIDEAFLDLGGTERLHHGSPALTLARFAKAVEEEHRLTVSVGLSYNKFLAKIASDLDKPRGFAVIGRAEAQDFLADRPVSLIWGVGKALEAHLARDGITRIGELRRFDEAVLVARYGAMGRRLHAFCRGEDRRRIDTDAPIKSISSETTFDRDLSRPDDLAAELWPLCETVARRLKQQALAGGTVSLKLKTAEFRIITRNRKLAAPTQLAGTLYQAALSVLRKEADERPFRLIGVGVSDLADSALADPPSLVDASIEHRKRVESTIDAVRSKLGPGSIGLGRGLAAKPPPAPRKPSTS
jgi:DNA polymerase-4